MSVQIYYFSGTGNSLFVAGQLQRLLADAELVPIVGALKASSPKTIADTIGFVFPCHGITIPYIVRKFMERADMRSGKYFFAVATRGGSIFRGFPLVEKLLHKRGKSLDASFVITMALNDPKLKSFTVPRGDDLSQIDKSVASELERIKKMVSKGERYNPDPGGVRFSDSGLLNHILERLIPFTVHHLARKIRKYFYADGKCAGCGTCAKVCPAQKILMVDGKPMWRPATECYTCYACLNFCPHEAVQIYSKFWMKSYTSERGRYPHPYATAGDISAQKT